MADRLFQTFQSIQEDLERPKMILSGRGGDGTCYFEGLYHQIINIRRHSMPSSGYYWFYEESYINRGLFDLFLIFGIYRDYGCKYLHTQQLSEVNVVKDLD